jgi:hypothetical protein
MKNFLVRKYQLCYLTTYHYVSAKAMALNIENFPSEIRILLLSVMDLEALRCIVRASSVYHQQYLLYREHLLRRCLEITLGSLSLGAFAVQKSSSKTFSETRTIDKVALLLDSHKASSTHYLIPREESSLDDLIKMANFHRLVIRPLVQHYTDWALRNIVEDAEVLQIEYDLSKIEEPSSKAEELRVMRSLYRFELFCSLFGLGPHKLDLELDSLDICMLVAASFEPWELKEISCIHTFTMSQYRNIFDSIIGGTHPQRYSDRKSSYNQPNGSMVNHLADIHLSGTTSRGLTFLKTIFLEPRGAADQALLRLDTFPLAWTLFWESSMIERLKNDGTLWGYVLWDSRELKRTLREIISNI